MNYLNILFKYMYMKNFFVLLIYIIYFCMLIYLYIIFIFDIISYLRTDLFLN